MTGVMTMDENTIPVFNPAATGAGEPCCPNCSCPVEFWLDRTANREECYCPQCGWNWREPEPQADARKSA
jgi:hypothetical protein